MQQKSVVLNQILVLDHFGGLQMDSNYNYGISKIALHLLLIWLTIR